MRALPYIYVVGACLSLSTLLPLRAQEAQERRQTTRRLSLEDCIRLAKERSLDLQTERLRIEQQRLQHAAQRHAFLPSVSAGISQSWSFGRSENQAGVFVDRSSSSSSFSVGAELPLYTGGRRLHDLKAAKLNLDAAVAQLQKAHEDLGIRITQLYIGALYQRDIAALMTEELLNAAEITRRARNMVAEGKWAQVKLVDAEAQEADRRLKVEEAEAQRQQAMLELLQAIEETEPNLSTELESLSLEAELRRAKGDMLSESEAYRRAMLYRPAFRAMELSISSAEEAVRSAWSGHLPQLSLSGGYSNSYFYQLGKAYKAFNLPFADQWRSNGRSYIGLNLAIPIFSRFATDTGVRMAKLNVLERKLELNRMQKSIYKEINQARLNAQLAESKIETARLALASAEVSSQMMYEQMMLGRSTLFEYNDAQLRTLNARLELSRAQHDFILKARILAFYASEPVSLGQ